MHTPESAELLKKMSTDQNELVRNEALRYLKERGLNDDNK
jgi:HEAT repeat protein